MGRWVDFEVGRSAIRVDALCGRPNTPTSKIIVRISFGSIISQDNRHMVVLERAAAQLGSPDKHGVEDAGNESGARNDGLDSCDASQGIL